MAVHPLASFVAQGVGGGNLRLEKLPSLSQLMATHGLKEGARRFDEEYERWRQNVERQLRELFAKATASEPTDLEDVSTPATETATTPSSTDALSAAISTVQASLNSHIGQTAAHGTASDVVGETDDQPLDGKQMGQNDPGPGRFTDLMWSNIIEAGESVTLPADCTMLAAGSFTVNGTFTINGEFRIIV